MHKFFIQILIFLIPIIAYCISASIMMPYLLSFSNGPSTKQQITYSFENSLSRNYELLILGNSRTYRGINPDVFSISKNAYNFSHDNDSYNQMYYKLKFILKKEKNIKYLILGVDYFQFSFKSDSRNYVYADFLENNYLKDFTNTNLLLLKAEYYLSNINPKKLLLLKPRIKKPFLRSNGQYIKYGKAKENDTITREIKRLDFQVSYFNKIIDLCKSKKIKTFIVMLPIRQNELKSYKHSEINEFDSFISDYADSNNVFYLNYSTVNNFSTSDFTDITHLNEPAANRFTNNLNKDLLNLINNKNKARKILPD